MSATNILNGTVGTAAMANGSVTSDKIANQTILGQDIAGGTIGQGKLSFGINGALINANSPQDTGNPDYLSNSAYQPNSPTEFTHHCPRGWVMVGLSGVVGGFMGHARIWCSPLGSWK